MRNFNTAFIEGSGNLKVSSVKDHAATEMHARAMLLWKQVKLVVAFVIL